MSDLKDDAHVVDHKTEVVEVKTLKGSEAFHEAESLEPLPRFHLRTIALAGCLLLGFFCQTVNGFDGSLFGGLTANDEFLKHFHGTKDGPWVALTSAMYQIGAVVALPFAGPIIDSFGRRMGMIVGAVLIVVGTIVNGMTMKDASVEHLNGQLKGGRFVLGFGVTIISAAGPIYVVETAHPAMRSVITAYCNTFWFVGSILASGAVRGALNLAGNTSWALPLWLQLVFPALVIIFVWFAPESPRWLYVHGKTTQAKHVLATWHGYGNPESAWVKLQLSEYEEFLELDGADKRWWDYSALFKTGASRYRLACNVCFSIFAQWAGNGVLTYFLPAVLDTAGYKKSVEQADINLGYACFQFVFALIGAAFVEKVGRRPMFLLSMAGCTIVWVGMTIASAQFASSNETNTSAAKATVAMIFLFGGVYSIGITPLQALYPVEVLSFEMRAKGMAFSSLAVNAGNLLNQFAWPISLANIGWKTYIVFTVWDGIMVIIWYFLLPETKKRTLEELDLVFEAKNPVKESLRKKKIDFSAEGQILAVEKL
ncbi:general substrate transporter [Karstenula rhodostoma CBS 690.94]|uniref:General substrate transporter n=1 Tax=Karstenula rhodostoma CBS 690.94 TaxID=1392251 RepID=A0A9P4UDT5_9PLEO|nr:general substrate transporter [Karstenula rhodostoma CBS 690.94]